MVRFKVSMPLRSRLNAFFIGSHFLHGPVAKARTVWISNSGQS